MKKIVLMVLGVLLLTGQVQASPVILVEDFEAAFPAWESGWFGTNSNAMNYYGIGQGRGNNPDGLWIDDGTANPLVTIAFTSTFAATLIAFSIDIAGFVPGTFSIFDKSGATLLSAPIPVNNGALTDPGTYGHFAVLSNNGIGGFSFLADGLAIEGNTSIDNVSVTVDVPEPSSLLLLGAGLAGFAAARRRMGLRNNA